ncbi:MAG: S-layer homology domain-containing protein [Armatimonadetes bacterium]|nr:S-layer homology domain-containing protein [Armatimonadota bacterium]
MAISGCLTLFSLAIAQAGGYSDVPAEHWAAPAVGSLVSAGLLKPERGESFKGDQPVTRYEFAVVMDRFVRDIRKSFIRQPKMKTINEKKITGRKEDGSQEAMVRLAREGFLPYYSPIFHGPSDHLTPEMLSVALSQVAVKISALFREEPVVPPPWACVKE